MNPMNPPPLDLPGFQPMAEAIFEWGLLDSATFITALNIAHKETAQYGKAGKSELARMYKAFASGSAMESIALKALPILILQKPSAKSKVKEHYICIERRLRAWLNGDLQDLIREGKVIQRRIPKPNQDSGIARSFSTMFEGSTRAAIRLLGQDSNNGKLCLNDPVYRYQPICERCADRQAPPKRTSFIRSNSRH